tara:strand:- start:3627 stop:5138 length:1512 start_codon:yes stop_codon:yes gene_type:complete
MKSYTPPGAKEDFEIEQVVVNGTDINLFNVSATRGTMTLQSPKALYLENTGPTSVQLVFNMYGYNNSRTQDETDLRVQHVLNPGEWYYLSNARIFKIDTSSPYMGTEVDNSAPDGNMYEDSLYDVDHATSAAMGSGTTETTLYLEQWTSASVHALNGLHVGDLIRIDNEIMEITAKGTGTNLANTYVTVKRGMYGSTAASHADDAAVRLPFFNLHHDFDTYTTAQTNSDGRYWAKNLFGKGRGAETYIDKGITPGSFAMKFYDPGYQEFGLSGLSSTSDSKLTAGRQYYFKIRIDGSGSGSTELNFTVDSSNTNWGGANGVISKIQAAIDAEYWDSGSDLYKKRAQVQIVEGDIRVSSGQRLSTSAILLEAGTSGSDANYELFAQLNGVVPVAADLLAPIAATLPDDVIYDPITNEEIKNASVFCTDDCRGNLKGAGVTGTLNYETGEIKFKGPANANWVYSVSHNSVTGGQLGATGNNVIKTITARGMNQKINGKVYLKIWN